MTASFPEPRPAPAPLRPGPLSILLRLVLGLLALAIPLFAVWLVTSLLLALGAPLVVALPLGVAVPLALPVVWDFWAEARIRRKPNPPARILARGDRIRLRILATCLLVIGVAVLGFGKVSGSALAGHGRWIMFGSQSPFAQDVQSGIEGLAGSGGAGRVGVGSPGLGCNPMGLGCSMVAPVIPASLPASPSIPLCTSCAKGLCEPNMIQRP